MDKDPVLHAANAVMENNITFPSKHIVTIQPWLSCCSRLTEDELFVDVALDKRGVDSENLTEFEEE
jgi:hypothetical protein